MNCIAPRYDPLTALRYTADMFGFSYSSLFKSRWMALLWAAGIIWSAYSFAVPETDGGSDAQAMGDSNAAMALVANTM